MLSLSIDIFLVPLMNFHTISITSQSTEILTVSSSLVKPLQSNHSLVEPRPLLLHIKYLYPNLPLHFLQLHCLLKTFCNHFCTVCLSLLIHFIACISFLSTTHLIFLYSVWFSLNVFIWHGSHSLTFLSLPCAAPSHCSFDFSVLNVITHWWIPNIS